MEHKGGVFKQPTFAQKTKKERFKGASEPGGLYAYSSEDGSPKRVDYYHGDT